MTFALEEVFGGLTKLRCFFSYRSISGQKTLKLFKTTVEWRNLASKTRAKKCLPSHLLKLLKT